MGDSPDNLDTVPLDVHDSVEYQYHANKRLGALFDTLDHNKDGFVDLGELKGYMDKCGQYGAMSEEMAKDIIKAGDIHKDGKLDYQEFMLYMIDHERVLWKSFKMLDKDGNGSICMDDLEQHCTANGITLDKKGYLERIDKDGNLQIEWEEWIQFHQFSPSVMFSDSMSVTNVYMMPGETALVIQGGEKQSPRKGGLLANFVCGGLAGAVSRTITAPLDRLKVMLQVQGSQQILGTECTKRLGAAAMCRQMYVEGGLRSFWKGNLINCSKIMPENAIRLALFDWLLGQAYLKGQDGLLIKFACGAVTGAAVQTFMFPIELIKTRVMLHSSKDSMGFWKTYCSLGDTRRLRIQNSFRGLSPALIGIIPFSGIELSSVRWISGWWADRQNRKYPGCIAGGIIGTSCTVSAAFLTYPMKLLTTRQQAHKGTEALGTRVLVNDIWRKDRLSGFWRGFVPNAFKVIPSSFASWTTYTMCLNLWLTYSRKHSLSY